MAEENNPCGIMKLPMELYDKISYHITTNLRIPPRRRQLKILRQVNRSFYHSSSRLLFRYLALDVPSCSDNRTWIPEILTDISQSQHRHSVKGIILKCHPQQLYLLTEGIDEVVTDEMGRLLAQFPHLRWLEFITPSRDNNPNKCRAPIARGTISSFQNRQPPNLRTVLLDNLGPESLWPLPGLLSLMPQLERFGIFYHNRNDVTAESREALSMALAKGENLRAVSLVRVKCCDAGRDADPATLIHPKAPLRSLVLHDIAVCAQWLRMMRPFDHSLEVLKMSQVQLTAGTWEDVFNDLFSGFSKIRNLRVHELQYHADSPYFAPSLWPCRHGVVRPPEAMYQPIWTTREEDISAFSKCLGRFLITARSTVRVTHRGARRLLVDLKGS